ncbi:hypothetical protein BH23ACT9_BH23ACT9_08920 [soil metagenome]
MDIAAIHGHVIGVTIMGSWVVVMVLALVLRLAAADAEVPWFWRIVSIAQILLGVQLLFGLVLLVIRGGLPGDDGLSMAFHPLYGFVFPLIVLFYAHRFSRDGRMHRFSAFATAGLVIFALTLRGYTAIVFGS